MQLCDLACDGVFDHVVAANDVGVFQADFFAGLEAEEFIVGFFAEVSTIDIELPAKGDLIGAQLRFIGIDL